MTPTELTTNANAIVEDLVELRRDRGLTQADIAQRCGISRVAVCQFERNRYLPGLFVLLRYADAVGADVSVVMRRSGR